MAIMNKLYHETSEYKSFTSQNNRKIIFYMKIYARILGWAIINIKMIKQLQFSQSDQNERTLSTKAYTQTSLRKTLFKMSMTYKLYRFLKKRNRQLKEMGDLFQYHRDGDIFVFKISRQHYTKIFGKSFRSCKKILEREGFKLQPQPKPKGNTPEKVIFRTLSHKNFNFDGSLQEVSDAWYAFMEKDFLNDKESFIGWIFHQLSAQNTIACWASQGKIHLTDAYAKECYRDSVQKFYGFEKERKGDIMILSHPQLRKESPIEDWVWTRQFFRSKMDNLKQISIKQKRQEKYKKAGKLVLKKPKEKKSEVQKREKNKQHAIQIQQATQKSKETGSQNEEFMPFQQYFDTSKFIVRSSSVEFRIKQHNPQYKLEKTKKGPAISSSSKTNLDNENDN